jgi:hypothetical protein
MSILRSADKQTSKQQQQQQQQQKKKKPALKIVFESPFEPQW